jgi:hypothetical protein
MRRKAEGGEYRNQETTAPTYPFETVTQSKPRESAGFETALTRLRFLNQRTARLLD